VNRKRRLASAIPDVATNNALPIYVSFVTRRKSAAAGARKFHSITSKKSEGSVTDGMGLDKIAEEAAKCTRCPLYLNATQTVFGEGSEGASMMMVGEQPGDKEDLAGRPFVGPAGLVLDRALAEAGIERTAIYVTNAVKHFKNESRGKRRLHKRPARGDIEACRWWLEKEIVAVDPQLVVALGASAASALMGRTVVLARERGQLLQWRGARAGLATIHPSAILRMRTEDNRRKAFMELVSDLREARRLLKPLRKRAS
jgi:uracil-DNA glycosylase